jgi:hypothetical protein
MYGGNIVLASNISSEVYDEFISLNLRYEKSIWLHRGTLLIEEGFNQLPSNIHAMASGPYQSMFIQFLLKIPSDVSRKRAILTLC